MPVAQADAIQRYANHQKHDNSTESRRPPMTQGPRDEPIQIFMPPTDPSQSQLACFGSVLLPYTYLRVSVTAELIKSR